MTDRTDFESALEARLLARAAIASRPFDASEIARSVVGADRRDRRSPFDRPWPGAARWWLIGALLLLGALGIAAGIGALRRDSPLPTGVISNGLVAAAANPWTFGSGYNADIYLLRVGQPEPLRPTIGSDGDGIAQQCPAFSPDGRMLAYGQARASGPGASLRGGWTVSDRAIVLVDVAPNGTASPPRWTLPVAQGGSIVCPAWSPRGDRLAFRVGESLSIVDRDTGTSRRWPISAVTGPEENELAWSHDGRRVAVSEDERVRIIDVDTGEVTIVPIPGAAPRSLDWTAGDHGLIAVSMVPIDEAGDAIYLLDAETGGSRRLTPKATEPGVTYSFGNAAVSPDGARVVYLESSSRCTSDSCGPGPQIPPIAIMNLNDGSSIGLEHPADGPTGALGTPFFASDVRWSPDGARLLLSSIGGIVAVDPGGRLPTAKYATGIFMSGLNLEWSPTEVSWQPVRE